MLKSAYQFLKAGGIPKCWLWKVNLFIWAWAMLWIRLHLFPYCFQGYHPPCHVCYNYVGDTMHCCPLDRPDTSTFHSASSGFVHLLLEPGFVEPSPQDLEVVPMWSPSSDRSFISRSMMVWERINSLFPTDGAKLIKSKLDLISIDGRSLVLAVKKRKAKEFFTSMRPVKNASMPKPAYQFPKEFLTSVSLVFHVSLPEFHFPFYSLLRVGAVMSVNAALSIFLLRGMPD